jgi:hypothetical protein
MSANRNNDDQERIKQRSERAIAYYYNDLELSDPTRRLLNRPRNLQSLPSLSALTTGRLTNSLSLRDHYRIFSTPILQFINPETRVINQNIFTFQFKGIDQTYTASAGAFQVEIFAWGGGGSQNGGTGGAGAFVTGKYNVTPGKQLRIVVGGGGWPLDASGINGVTVYGGGGGRFIPTGWGNTTSSGGGLSGVFDGTYSQANAVCVAGGGGGGSGGGNARWTGKSEDGGGEGNYNEPCGGLGRTGGQGGSQTAGGARGCTGNQYGEFTEWYADSRPPGSALQGGWSRGLGGSGGGGYFGGGAGAFGNPGGAGSSFTGRLSEATGENGSGGLAGGRTNRYYISGIGNGGGGTGGGRGLVVLVESVIFNDIFRPPPI